MSASLTVLTHLDSGVLRISLNRPDKLNAFNEEMHLALRAAIQRAHGEAEIRAVLLTGNGRAFCAGQDLGDRDPRKRTDIPDLGRTLDTYYNPTVRLMRALRKPIVCAVNGVAAGAGANIALAADIVIAAKSARFIQAFSKIGLVPDAGGSWHLPRILGEARAKALALLAEPLSAERAEQWGLIWQAVEDAELPSAAFAMALKLAEGPTLSLGLTKQLIQDAAMTELSDQLDAERDAQRIAGRSDDYSEGVLSFLDKRPAIFRGS